MSGSRRAPPPMRASRAGAGTRRSSAHGSGRISRSRSRNRSGECRPRQRDFSLMVRDGDVASASNYLAVRGHAPRGRQAGPDLRGRRGCGPGGSRTCSKDLVATFDDRIVPVAARSVGLANDIDGDGRFTVLLSSWLNRLGSGRHAVDGFVRVTDLDPAFPPPFGNHCDMMYLSTGSDARAAPADRPGSRIHARGGLQPEIAVARDGAGESRWRKRAGSTKPSRTWPRTCTASPDRTSTIA